MNILAHPEELGLEVVAEIEYSDDPYQFDTRVVWRHIESGVLFTARDHGCSCPTPFGDYTCLGDLEGVVYTRLRDEAMAMSKDSSTFLSRIRDVIGMQPTIWGTRL